jgi:hypothetical protein
MNSSDGNETTGSDLMARREAIYSLGAGSDAKEGHAVGVGAAARPNLAEESLRQRGVRRLRALLVGAEYRLKQRVKHPDGGEGTVNELLTEEKEQRTRIQEETQSGSRKHGRFPDWIHRIPRYVFCFDFMLLLYFFGGITNVLWAEPLSMALAFALMLAAMVTLLSYGFLAFTGHRLRTHKNHAGTVHREDVDGVTKLACALSAAVIAVIAALMFLRMHTEILYALGAGQGLTAVLIASALAVISATANFLVVAIHALDGSDEVARLNRLAAAVREPYAKSQRMREEAAQYKEIDG